MIWQKKLARTGSHPKKCAIKEQVARASGLGEGLCKRIHVFWSPKMR